MTSPTLTRLATILSLLLFSVAGVASDVETAPQAEDTEVSYPRTPYHQLPADLQQKFRGIAESELCPCEGSVDSLHVCLQEEDACGIARAGAFSAMQALFRGRSEEEARQAMAEQIAAFEQVHEFSDNPAQTKGSDDASVTIVEFADFECPHCRRVSSVLSRLAADDSADVQIQFKHFPLSTHRNAEEAAIATVAAGNQGEFWAFHDKLFEKQSELQSAIDPLRIFREIAEEIGLDIEQFNEDFRAPETYRAVSQQKAEGTEAGLSGTPTLFINGRIYLGEFNLSSIRQAVENAETEDQ
jgi:protein-disulfide isomerase